MRDARNGAAFQAWVKAETGWNMEIISGLEEGRLIHLGVTGGEPGAGGKVLLIDLGGGSCEITLSEHKRIKETISVPLGAVRLTEDFLSADPAPSRRAGADAAVDSAELRRAHKNSAWGVPLVIATSGTAAALSDAMRRSADERPPKTAVREKRQRKRGERNACVNCADAFSAKKLSGNLAKMTLPEREAVPGIGPRRAEIIVAGAEVYAELLESFGLAGFRYSPLGLRDGILAQMLAEQDARATAHREFEHERWESVLATARRYGVDPKQAEPVRAHAVQLFHELKALHQLPAEYESWLAAAAMLRDTGKFINHQGHHRHTQYIVSSSEIYGYTGRCSGRWFRRSRATWARADRSRATGRCRNIPAEEHKQRATGGGAAAAGCGAEPGPRQRRAARGGGPVSKAGLPGVEAGTDGRGAGVVVAAQRGGLLPRGLWAGALSHAGIDGARHAGIDEPLQPGRMAVEIDAGDGALAHADGCAAVAGDEAAEELKQVGVVPTASMPSRSAYLTSMFWKSAKSAVGSRLLLTSTLPS
jgi:exopolyphosphatase/guanosine-5'-triphosphate,3'-diphosphate pyrophosphatase